MKLVSKSNFVLFRVVRVLRGSFLMRWTSSCGSRCNHETHEPHETARTRSLGFQVVALLLLLAQFEAAPASPRRRVAASQTATSTFAPSEKSWKAADKLLKKMSVDEKVGQLVHVGI